MSSSFPEHYQEPGTPAPRGPLRTSQLGLVVGLVLGAVWVFGGFGHLLAVAACAAIGYAVGMVLEGRWDVTELLERWRR